MISTRFVPALCIVVAIALVPTLIHSYAGAVVRDGRTTSSIDASLAGFVSAPSSRDAGWGARRFNSDDWFERRYLSGNDEVLLTVIRSYDLKRLYHHPELDVAYGAGFLRHEVRRFAADPAIPVHVLYSDVQGGSVAVYALHYDDGFVEDPLLFQLRSAGELLIGGRRPMTLIFARAMAASREADPETLGATRVLFAAIQQFVSRETAE